MGPSGETTRAAKIGDALFPMNTDSPSLIKFKDALYVPKISKSLLSVRQICANSPDVSIIFSQDKCQIFRGQISLIGETIVQGKIDDSGLMLSPTNSTTMQSKLKIIKVLSILQSI